MLEVTLRFCAKYLQHYIKRSKTDIVLACPGFTDINCSKKVWNITFALNFCTYSFIIFTWFLHVLKDCLFSYILQKNA